MLVRRAAAEGYALANYPTTFRLSVGLSDLCPRNRVTSTSRYFKPSGRFEAGTPPLLARFLSCSPSSTLLPIFSCRYNKNPLLCVGLGARIKRLFAPVTRPGGDRRPSTTHNNGFALNSHLSPLCPVTANGQFAKDLLLPLYT